MPLPGNIQQIWVGSDNWLDSNGGILLGKILRVIPTADRLNDAGARAVILSVPAEHAVDSGGVAWVKVPATDDSDLNPGTYTLGVNEPTGESYFIFGPSSSPVETHDDGTGAVALPTVDLSQDVTKAPAPVPGLAQIMRGIGITSTSVTSGHLIITYDDGTTQDAGTIAGSGAVDSVTTPDGTVQTGAVHVNAAHGVVESTDTRLTNARTPTTHGASHKPGGTDPSGLTAADVGAPALTAAGVPGGYATLDLSGNVVQPSADGGSGSGTVSSVNGVTPDISGNVHITVDNVDGAVDTSDARLSDARPRLPASYAAEPVNVRDTGNPLADAIMDGSSHPLSGRFASLPDAQVVFPSAAALTDEIDYWAIQTVINTSPRVDLSIGTAILHKALQHNDNQEIAGRGPNITVLKVKDGANTNALSSADLTNENENVTLRDFTVDGNSANNTAAIGQTDGILLSRCANLRMHSIEVHHVNGRGIHHHGLTGSIVSVQEWAHIYVHDNMHWGLWNTNGVRIVNYDDIKCVNNGLRTDISLTQTGNSADAFTGGFLLDHSEVTGSGITCIGNGQDGLWIRNAFDVNLYGVRSNRNGRHGVRVLGMVDSTGVNWNVQTNGQNPALASHNIWFDGTGTLDYGVTAGTKLTNIQAGPNPAALGAHQGAWPADGTDYAVWFDDNMTNSDLDAAFKVYPGTAGTIRYPSAGLGSLRVNDGSGLERVELFPASGTAIQLGGVNTGAMKRINLTANCDITLPPPVAGQVITCNVIQPATGGPFTPTFHPSDGIAGHMKYPNGNTVPTWTTAGGSADRIAWICDDGVHQVGFVEGQNI